MGTDGLGFQKTTRVTGVTSANDLRLPTTSIRHRSQYQMAQNVLSFQERAQAQARGDSRGFRAEKRLLGASSFW